MLVPLSLREKLLGRVRSIIVRSHTQELHIYDSLRVIDLREKIFVHHHNAYKIKVKGNSNISKIKYNI